MTSVASSILADFFVRPALSLLALSSRAPRFLPSPALDFSLSLRDLSDSFSLLCCSRADPRASARGLSASLLSPEEPFAPRSLGALASREERVLARSSRPFFSGVSPVATLAGGGASFRI